MLCVTSTPAEPGVATALQCADVEKHLARGRHLGCKCGRPDRLPLTPLARGAELYKDEPRPWTEAEAGKSNVPRRRFKMPWNLGNRQRDPVQFLIIRRSISGSSHFAAAAIHRSISACNPGSSAYK